MKKALSCFAFLLAIILSSTGAVAQQKTLSGTVTNAQTGEPLGSASVIVKGSDAGTMTDAKGAFKLTVSQALPVTLAVSSVGYESQDVRVSSETPVRISLNVSAGLGQDIIISALRTPSRILESPVSVERISSAAIRNSSAPSYYDIIGNLKEVDMVTSSLTFKTPSTRGFNGSGNLRFNQIVDGMDNQAPGLNFSVGTIVGLNELEVESMELLPGASSALYGPGGMNGTLLINSKSAFKNDGLSFQVKTGIMHVDDNERKPSPYYNWTLRYAKKITEKFAFKLGGELLQAKDWYGNDYRNYDRLATSGNVKPGTRETDPNYDGVNVYGDETTIDLKSNVLAPVAAAAPFYAPYINSLPATINVSRTGYKEKDIIDPTTINFKLSGGLEYKIRSNTRLIAAAYFGTGNSVYSGSDRYSLKDLKIGQYKIELNNPKWYLRAYTTQEDAGSSFNATVTTRLFNEQWKPSGGSNGWYAQYGMAFLQGLLNGMSQTTAHNYARSVADQGRPAAGSTRFKELFDEIRSIPISQGGGLFVDKTALYQVEGQYNLSSYTSKFADVLVGGNYKKYLLNSEGTLFADSAGKIGINEFGAYVQATKQLLKDRLKLIGSIRYDKNENFDGKFTPRISAVIKVAPENNIRLSYQSAYRFGSTQQQWINLRVGGGTRLLGGLKTLQDYYHFNTNPVYSVNDMQNGKLQQRVFDKFKAETVNSFEAGYKGLLIKKKLLVDLYGYYSINNDFIARELVAQSVNGDPSVFTNPVTLKGNLADPSKVNVYSVPTNVSGEVKTYGLGLSLDYALRSNFTIGGSGSYDRLTDVPDGLIAYFNAPKYRTAFWINNSGFGKDKAVVFNVTWRWQDEVAFQGDFASGTVPAYHTLDAQVGYKFVEQKILLKVGGSNILNQYYRNGVGNAAVGGLYYVSIGYNVF